MKIIYRKSEIGAGKYIGIGIKNGFAEAGHDVLMWDGKDMEKLFTEFEPDLFFGNVNNLNEVNINFLNDHPSIKVVAWSYPWCDIDTTKDMLLVSATQDQADIVKKINNFKGIITNYTQKNADNFYHKWKDNGINVISFPLAADTTTYYPVEAKKEYRCDISYVGNYWEKKAKNGIDKYILPLKEKHNLKIWGEWGWPDGLCLGKLPFGADRDVFCSSKINLTLHEPHSRNLGIDVISRVFNIAACKAFQVSDYVEEINEFFYEPEIAMCTSVENYYSEIAYYLANARLREDFAEKAYKRVLKEHTYKHRVEKLLKAI
ncbi:hypothetical protein LCGC14_1652350 [marine sediment metagenome]|uniref:Spore protein YkvP/CgeB glycosyl transferase-like domain-containing protein n=1 Tax=marine sediment metagenome TaxID=412755 RepID=A0A0F9HX73_9ZZZZ